MADVLRKVFDLHRKAPEVEIYRSLTE